MKWLGSLFGWLFGLVGLALPGWLLPVVLIASVLTALGGAYVKGRLDASSNCREAQVRAELASLKRDRDAALAAEMTSTAMNEAIKKQNAELEGGIAAYEIELSSRPPDTRCAHTPDDIRGLRNRGRN